MEKQQLYSETHWADFTRPKLDEGMTMYIDYIRIYQEEGKESITCDPRECSSSQILWFLTLIG